jgi:hypothetical protein
MIIGLSGNAQRLGIKPFAGISYNGSKVIIDDGGPLFTESQQASVRFTGGILFSYAINPKCGIEYGYSSLAYSVNYNIFNPLNLENAGHFNRTERRNFHQLNFTQTFYKHNDHLQLKWIAGFNFFNVNNVTGGKLSSNSIDTTIANVSDFNLKSQYSYNSFRNWGTAVNFGIGSEFLFKQRVIAEWRLSALYTSNPFTGSYCYIDLNGTKYKNEHEANQLSFNSTLLINLSSLLGSNRKED